MSALRYRTLLTNLPGMAAVVNAFNSPDVQQKVYEALMGALNGKMEADGLATPTQTQHVPQTSSHGNTLGSNRSSSLSIEQELAHELVEGESIHAVLSRN